MTARFASTTALALSLAAHPFAALAQVGSGNVASIEPTSLAHPPTKPCTVPLYTGATFGGSNVDYAYTPPAGCPGPWAKVVLAVDISLNAGNQYDRTGTIWFGGVNLWFGTTAEPRANLGPSWHVERDVTDDTALFETANTGTVLIANYFDAADTSTITSSAKLVFYPADKANPAPRTPDVVIPLTGTSSSTVSLASGTDTLSRTLTLPANIERAVFDTVLQGQYDDEFWYGNAPAALASELDEYPGGTFREGELTIDGKNAGLAPVYPAVFTGGIDPYLWTPIPGVTTLDLRPFRIELTPFAGELDTPGAHTISLSVFGAANYFSVEGTLYLYLDKKAASDTGALTADTLAPPAPTLTNTLTGTTTITGALTTRSNHAYTLTGTLSTSHGAVTTTVAASSDFTNIQSYHLTPSTDVQDIAQDTETSVAVTTKTASGTSTATSHYSYPIVALINESGTNTDTIAQTTQVAQGLLIARQSGASAVSLLAEGILSQDTTSFIIDPSAGTVTLGPPSNTASAAIYGSDGAFGCHGRLLASSADALTYEQTGVGCGTSPAASAVKAMIAKIPH